METLKKFLQTKIDEYIDILKIKMIKENVNEITYDDNFTATALGGLNMAVGTMMQIDPTFTFNLGDYFPEAVKKIEHDNFKRRWANSRILII